MPTPLSMIVTDARSFSALVEMRISASSRSASADRLDRVLHHLLQHQADFRPGGEYLRYGARFGDDGRGGFRVGTVDDVRDAVVDVDEGVAHVAPAPRERAQAFGRVGDLARLAVCLVDDALALCQGMGRVRSIGALAGADVLVDVPQGLQGRRDAARGFGEARGHAFGRDPVRHQDLGRGIAVEVAESPGRPAGVRGRRADAFVRLSGGGSGRPAGGTQTDRARHEPEHDHGAGGGQHGVHVVAGEGVLPGQLDAQVIDELCREVGDLAGRGLREQLPGRGLLGQEHVGVRDEVGDVVGQRRGQPVGAIVEALEGHRQAALGRIGRRRQVGVDVVRECCDLARQVGVHVLRLQDVRRRQGQVARGVADDRVAGLEPLDAFLTCLDGVHIGAHVVGESIRDIGNAPNRGQQQILELIHARDEGRQGIEIRQRIRAHARGFDAPVRRQLAGSPARLRRTGGSRPDRCRGRAGTARSRRRA